MNDGGAFEDLVIQTLRLIPGASVEEHRRISGKDVDIYCVVNSPLTPAQRIAVECKDLTRRMSRAGVAEVLAHYWPLLESGNVDQVLLVTRNGIVSNASALLDGTRARHMTQRELVDQALRPQRLLRNMQDQFLTDAEYYIPTHAYAVPLKWVSEHFDLVYCSFATFALQTGGRDLNAAKRQWRSLTEGMPDSAEADEISSAMFQDIRGARESEVRTLLEITATNWLSSKEIRQGLAIVGSYGTGKSTFARSFAASLARQASSGVGRIPILIELRNFGGHQNIESLIVDELQRRHGLDWSFETFSTLNRAGRLVVILDGFDEMKHGMTRDALLYNFDQLAQIATGHAKVMICGRPTAFATDDEQVAILAGHGRANAQYIQVAIAPFTAGEVFSFLQKFCRARYQIEPAVLESKLTALSELQAKNLAVSELLARPVHLPMIAELMPTLEISESALARANVYDAFISQVIARQVRRQRSPFPSADNHRRFSEDIALLMLSMGESRAVRFSEIPDALVSYYRRDGQTLDECRRQYVASSFLERKPPDVLYFGHKSFAEFLAASAIHRQIKSGAHTQDLSLSVLSNEVVSFISELCSSADMRSIICSPRSHAAIIQALLSASDRKIRRIMLEPGVCEILAADIPKLPKLLTFHILNVWSESITMRSSSGSLRYIAEACGELNVHAVGAIQMLAIRLLDRVSSIDARQKEAALNRVRGRFASLLAALVRQRSMSCDPPNGGCPPR